MAQVTAEQLLNKVQAQAGRIAQLELMVDALTAENAQLQAALAAAAANNEMAEVKAVAGEISKNGKQKPVRA